MWKKATIIQIYFLANKFLFLSFSIPFIFGIVTMLSGVVGVPVGSILSVKLRPKFARSDPIICGAGLVIASIFLCIAIFTCNKAFILAFVLIFFGEIALNLNWSIVADILLVSLFFQILFFLIKFIYSEKATTIWRDLQTCFDTTK